jgi:hypothetical protein
MERGPLALFGAIVAVGLGPAMWLGAQFGHVTLAPEQAPPAAVIQDEGHGGVGAAAPDPTVVATRPKAQVEPLRPHTRKPSPRASASTSPSTSASASPSASASASASASTPPVESSSAPSDPSGGSGGEVPPSPSGSDPIHDITPAI